MCKCADGIALKKLSPGTISAWTTLPLQLVSRPPSQGIRSYLQGQSIIFSNNDKNAKDDLYDAEDDES